ncbi:MAG: TIGR01212 family radical SAM protein [Bacilli bacterium]|nr:TIGR01212 family radical SAM protein [Bacilli bacterium]MDD4809363.1 TIGR01212 family radical SAM protein [Bacilli bacterium]
MNPFRYSYNNKRYHTLDYHYKKLFNSKVFKISLNAGFSCPNIDGKIGTKGCIYCSKTGSGEYAGQINKDLLIQFEDGIKLMNKWDGKYIAYFQAHTNTYAPLETLKEKYELFLDKENVIGITIATRPDAITDECLKYLSDLNRKIFLTIELGLQTIHEKTSFLINRCHTLKQFDDMVHRLRLENINVVVHIINGLPYETKEMMLETVKHLNKLDIQGLKIHMLYILKNTALNNLYQKERFHLLTKEEYIDIVCNQLELLRPDIVIHRITGDPLIDDLIEPKWLIKKTILLNDIDKELVKRNSYQGKKV